MSRRKERIPCGVASVVPSSADLYYELSRAFADDIDKKDLGKLNAETWELGMRRLIAFRDGGHDHRFFDIQFASFQSYDRSHTTDAVRGGFS